MVEGTPLLREHTGQNLYPGFESLRLRQIPMQANARDRLVAVTRYFAEPDQALLAEAQLGVADARALGRTG